MSHDDGDLTWVIAIALVICLVVAIIGIGQCGKDDCQARGGHIIHIHSTQDPLAWACEERR